MAGPGPVSHPAPTPRNDIPRGEGFAPPTPATPWEASEVNVSPRLPPRYCFPATHPRLYLCSSDEGPEEEVGCPSCLFNVSISCFSEVHLPPRSRGGAVGPRWFPRAWAAPRDYMQPQHIHPGWQLCSRSNTHAKQEPTSACLLSTSSRKA